MIELAIWLPTCKTAFVSFCAAMSAAPCSIAFLIGLWN
jgi:hypothetical protein